MIGPLPADGIPSGLPGIVISGGTEVSLSAACAGAAEMVAKAVATMVVSEVRAVAVVDGATVVMKEPSKPDSVGMQCVWVCN